MTKEKRVVSSKDRIFTSEENRAKKLMNENQLLRNEVIRLKNKLLIRQAEMINDEGLDYIPTTLLKAI